jgi:hypothetical protein
MTIGDFLKWFVVSYIKFIFALYAIVAVMTLLSALTHQDDASAKKHGCKGCEITWVSNGE